MPEPKIVDVYTRLDGLPHRPFAYLYDDGSIRSKPFKTRLTPPPRPGIFNRIHFLYLHYRCCGPRRILRVIFSRTATGVYHYDSLGHRVGVHFMRTSTAIGRKIRYSLYHLRKRFRRPPASIYTSRKD